MGQQGAWEEDSLLLEAQRGEAVPGKDREGSPPAGLGTKGRWDQWGKEQRAGLAGDHHRRGSHRQGVVDKTRPVVRTAGHGSHHTLEGSLTWT